MRHGPLIFAGALTSVAASWAALVMVPQLQFGALAPWPIPNTTETHPAARPGLAAQGAEIYRSLGCQQCHTRQVRSDHLLFSARLIEKGSNVTDVLTAIVRIQPSLNTNSAVPLLAKLPHVIVDRQSQRLAEDAVRKLADAGAKVELVFNHQGGDLALGWGARRSVARDYLFDQPVMLGNLRTGPDLANLGSRSPDNYAAPWQLSASPTNTTAQLAELAEWHLQHLYNPRSKAPASTMPGYKFLFEERKVGAAPSPDALPLAKGFAPAAGQEVVPTHAARALVAYLLNQRADVSVPEAPVSKPVQVAAKSAAATTPPAAKP